MAYNTKPIVTDKDGNPISQYYNPDTDQYEPVNGAGGGNAVILYNEDGTPNNSLSLIPILEKLEQLTGSVIDEQYRQANEVARLDNEQLRIQLYNDLLAELGRIAQITEQVPQSVLDELTNLSDKIGDLQDLTTGEKTNLIAAINEIVQNMGGGTPVDIDYDNTESELAAENVQEAIDEVNHNLMSHEAEMRAHGISNLSNANLIINGDFRVWQRGEVFASGGNRYTADRWYLDGSGSVSKKSDDAVGNYIEVTTNDFYNLQYKVENPELPYGKNITLSFYAKKVSGEPVGSMRTRLFTYLEGISLNTEWAKFTITTNIVSSDTIYIINFATSQGGSPLTYAVAQVKLEIGEMATPFTPRPIAEELTMCKRYYRLWTEETARTNALKEAGLMRLSPPTIGVITIGDSTYYYADAEL